MIKYGRKKRRIPEDKKFKEAVVLHEWIPTWNFEEIEHGRRKNITWRPPKNT